MVRAGLGACALLAAAAAPSLTALAQDDAGGALEDLDRAARAVVERCGPAVVRVEGERSARLRVVASSAEERRRLEEKLRAFGPREAVEASGFLLEEPGLVLTTSSAAGRGSLSIRVVFPGGVVREGRLAGEDPLSGVALVRVEPVEGVRALRLSDREPRPGTVSLLLAPQDRGPPGLHFGFVTDPRRTVWVYDAFLVSSVPVGPGHAGAPLLDARGDVLGVAVAARERPRGRGLRPGLAAGSAAVHPTLTQAFEAAAVAEEGEGPSKSLFVPAAEIRRIAADLRDLGRVRRGMLGVRLVRGEPVVTEVVAGTPAAGAGIAPGDRVLSLDGAEVPDADALTGFVQRRAPGAQVRLRILAPDGKEREVEAALAELPPPLPPPRALFNGLGVSAGEPPDLSKARFSTGIAPGGRFVIVRSVSEGSAAAEAGILPGDWLVEIDRRPVLSEDDYVLLATGVSSPSVEVRIYRPGEEDIRTVVLR